MYCEALRQARLNAKMTQKDVSESLNITQSAVCQFETGIGSEPSISRLFQLADLYNVSLDQLLGRDK